MSSGGLTAAYDELAPRFTETTGIELSTVYGASMGGAPTSIPMRLESGEPADVVILAADGFEHLVRRGHVDPSTRVDLASSRIGAAVREGSPVPDVSTVDAFARTLRDAESIAYSASASGTYLSTVLFPRLGVCQGEDSRRCLRVAGERVGAVVARGEASIGFQQVSELLPIPGITYVGTIPEPVQKITMFSAAVTSRTSDRKSAQALIAFLASRESAPVIRRTGMEPESGR